MPGYDLLASPYVVGLLTCLILLGIIAFVLYAAKRNGQFAAMAIATILVVPTVVGGLVLARGDGAGSARSSSMVGAFETVADTIKPTAQIDAGAETDEDKQLSELMAAILD